MNADLVRAISEKRLVEFVYKAGRTRLVEPHDYGLRGAAELLLGFQLGGESRTGTAHGWKHFDVAQIHQFRVLDRRFDGMCQGSYTELTTLATFDPRLREAAASQGLFVAPVLTA